MCYECGCFDKDLVISNASITEETFKQAALKAGITLEEAKRNTLELLKYQLNKSS